VTTQVDPNRADKHTKHGSKPTNTKSITWGSPQEQSLWKLLHEEKYDLNMRLTWFCDGPELGFIKGRVLARYIEEVSTATSSDREASDV
jgi:hypothetical protein